MRQRIWIPESFDCKPTVPEINMGFTIGVGGYFIVDLIDAESGKIKEHYEFPNLITDLGLDQVTQGARQSVLFNYIGVGTDATAPTVSDTALGAEVDRTNSDGGFGGLAIDGGVITGSAGPLDAPYWFKRVVRLFIESEANGNLTELGWFRDAAAGVMIVRSLFKDSGGTPIVITKTSAEQLRIIYEWRIYPPVGENPPDGNPNSPISSGEVILGPTTHSWTASANNIFSDTNWGWGGGNGMLAATLVFIRAQASPSGGVLIHPTGSDFSTGQLADPLDVDAYSVGSFERTFLATWPSSTGANFGTTGITGFNIRAANSPNGHFQIAISESIPKTVDEQLRVSFRVTVDRAVF